MCNVELVILIVVCLYIDILLKFSFLISIIVLCLTFHLKSQKVSPVLNAFFRRKVFTPNYGKKFSTKKHLTILWNFRGKAIA